MRKTNTTNKQRLNTAFDVAESKLGIARLLDADDVDVPKPEEKSIMTYVAQFLHKYPEPKVSFFFKFKKIFIVIKTANYYLNITGGFTTGCENYTRRI